MAQHYKEATTPTNKARMTKAACPRKNVPALVGPADKENKFQLSEST